VSRLGLGYDMRTFECPDCKREELKVAESANVRGATFRESQASAPSQFFPGCGGVRFCAALSVLDPARHPPPQTC
jgi:hypothetical protein